MTSTGWSFDEAVVDTEGKIRPEGPLLTNAKKAVQMMKEQGVKTERWVF
jgi:hypothetical protein